MSEKTLVEKLTEFNETPEGKEALASIAESMRNLDGKIKLNNEENASEKITLHEALVLERAKKGYISSPDDLGILLEDYRKKNPNATDLTKAFDIYKEAEVKKWEFDPKVFKKESQPDFSERKDVYLKENSSEEDLWICSYKLALNTLNPSDAARCADNAVRELLDRRC